MVGTNAHGHVDGILFLADGVLCLLFEGEVFQTSDVLFCFDDGLEHIGVVVRVLTLHHTNQTLESHTSVNDIHRELLQRAVSLAVELHEHKVPYLYDLWVVLVDELTPRLA